MTDLQTAFDHNAFPLWVGALALLIVLGFWLWRVHARAKRVEARLDNLLSGSAEENTARMLAEYLTTVRTTASAVARVKSEHDQMAKIMPTVVRHVGLVRFSPFHDTGGDQSFTLALLDGHADGIVITALHSRTDSRLYAKPIERGKSTYSLTPEERDAMDRALHREQARVGT